MDAAMKHSDHTASLVRKSYLDSFLDHNKFALVWWTYQEKIVVEGFAAGNTHGFHEERDAYVLNKGIIRKIGTNKTFRQPSAE